MDEAKRKRIEAAGFKVMTVAEFLGETPAESAHIEMSLDLSEALKAKRLALGLTQKAAAKQMGTTQPNIARMEFGVERAVTMDLLIKYLLQLGCMRAEIGAIVAGTDTLQPEVKPLVAQAEMIKPSPRRRAAPKLAPKAIKARRAKVEA